MLTFELVTLSGVKFGEEVYEVVLPTPDGLIAIFPHHIPLVSLAVPGEVRIRRLQADSDEQMERFAVHGGVIEINDRRVRLLVDEAELPEEIVEEEAAAALERAREMAAGASDRASLEKAQAEVQLAMTRLRVAELKRRKRRN